MRVAALAALIFLAGLFVMSSTSLRGKGRYALAFSGVGQ